MADGLATTEGRVSWYQGRYRPIALAMQKRVKTAGRLVIFMEEPAWLNAYVQYA